MTKNYYDPVTDHDLDMIELIRRHPDLPISDSTLKGCLFQLAQHIRNLHDKHETSFNAGVQFQKAMKNESK